MILRLPGGYDFQVSAGGAALSGGQRQRIALTRAFYGSPVVVVMDEPDWNLDAEGTMALARAVEGHKKRGGAAVIVAHRHGAFAQCDRVYVMKAGRPVPATPGRGKAPVRRLQGARKGEDALPPPSRSGERAGGGQTATQAGRAPAAIEPSAATGSEEVATLRDARGGTGRRPGEVEERGIPTLPPHGAEPIDPAARGRERQIAAAIARVSRARVSESARDDAGDGSGA